MNGPDAQGRYWWRRVSSENVPSETRRAARAAVAFACADLQLPLPVLVWFREAGSAGPEDAEHFSSDEPMIGQAWPEGVVCVSADLDPDRAAMSAAHEVRHLWQFQTGALPRVKAWTTKETMAGAERDARAYMRRVVELMRTSPAGADLAAHIEEWDVTIAKLDERLAGLLDRLVASAE